jgi:hypothetical protein
MTLVNSSLATLSPVLGDEKDTYLRMVYGTQSAPFSGVTPGRFYDLRARPVPYVKFDKTWFVLELSDDTYDGQLATVVVTRENTAEDGATKKMSITLMYPKTFFGVHLAKGLNGISVSLSDGTELANIPIIAARYATFLYQYALELYTDTWERLELIGTELFGAMPIGLTKPLIGFDDYLPHAQNVNEIARLFVVDAFMNSLGSTQGIEKLSQALIGSTPLISKPVSHWVGDAWVNHPLSTSDQLNGREFDVWTPDDLSSRWVNFSRLFWNSGNTVTAGKIDVSVDGLAHDFSALEDPVERDYDAGSEWIETESQSESNTFDFQVYDHNHAVVQRPGLFDYARSTFDTSSAFNSNHVFDTVMRSLDPKMDGDVGMSVTPGPLFYSGDSIPMGILSRSAVLFEFPQETCVLSLTDVTA